MVCLLFCSIGARRWGLYVAILEVVLLGGVAIMGGCLVFEDEKFIVVIE